MRPLYLLVLALLLCVGAQAVDLDYTVTGTYGAPWVPGTLDNALVAASTPFSFTFTLPQDPASLGPAVFSYATDPFSGRESFTLADQYVQYQLGEGAPIEDLHATLTFYNLVNSGMLEIQFSNNALDLNLYGPQLYIDPASAPTLIMGGGPAITTAIDTPYVEVVGVGYWDVLGGFAATDPSPEPGTWLFMLGAGLLAAPYMKKLRKRS